MEENKINIINSKIATKQLELNDEKDQEKRNEIMHQIKILNIRKEIETSKEKLKEGVSNTNLNKYFGRIRVKNGGQQLDVHCYATSTIKAKKIIEAQFDVKTWVKQMVVKK
ncbi:hypothetical protein [Polaribacter sp. IC063]|uniref:hypothetical protein n=1 Tax=Polaribacter sp. IC063 TaxID=57031 RepID=UPI0011BF4A84|nr:hypothetical protein [Polaribacter sp. IC063]TXD53651.1 hypothetical protein ES043_03235 [Polaribacter sp. IC063]